MSGRHLWYHEFFFHKKKFLFCDISFKRLLDSVFKKKWIKVIKSDRISKCVVFFLVLFFFCFFLSWSWQGPLLYTLKKIMKRKTDPYGRRWRSKQNKTVKWSFIYFFYHFSCCKDQLTVFNWKFGSQYFTDPDPLKIRRTLNGLSLWFCLLKCFLNKINKRKNIYLNKFSQYFGLKTYLPQGLKEKWR